MNNKVLLSSAAAACGAVLLLAQPPAPAPVPAQVPPPAAVPMSVSTATGAISQFNYGPDGQVEGIVIAPGTLVPLPANWALLMEQVAKVGTQVRVTGSVVPALSGMRVMQPQSVSVAGKTWTLTPPAAPAPYTGTGVIQALNYGRQGEVNGFFLQNGILARTPPFGMSNLSALKPGVSLSLSGFARTTAMGRTVVEVQSVTVNGQTIAMNAAPRPQPERGPKARRGPRGAEMTPPPPPPLAQDAPAPPPPPQGR